MEVLAMVRHHRRQSRLRDAFMAILALLAVTAVPARGLADCGRDGVTILGSPDERDEACAALGEVIGHFADGGLVIDLRVTIRFQPSVVIERDGDAAVSPTGGEQHQASGFYHIARREIWVTRSTSAWTHRRRPWNLPWDRPLALSILKHEIAHAIIYQLLGADHRKLPRAWHEALAYAVQIELMPPDLRARILARYPDRGAFSSTLHINDIVYGIDPDSFAVAAYKTYVQGGRMTFLRRAISLQFEMIDMDHMPP
jgi:hypothetical protein